MAFMAQLHEVDTSQSPEAPIIVEPVLFVPLQIRRSFGDWEYQVHSILQYRGLLAGRDPYTGKPEERLKFFETPKKHENSDALYIFEGELGRDWVGIYYLPPNSTTSQHEHPLLLSEDCHVLRGQMSIYVDDQTPKIIKGGVDKFTIHSGQRHYSRTGENEHALVMVIMIGGAKFPEEERHLNSSRPVIFPLDAGM